MFDKYPFQSAPVARQGSVVQTATQRITLLTDGLVRFETSPNGKFEDRASTFAINRDLPIPKFDLIQRDGDKVEIVTDRFHLLWTGEAFSPTSLHVMLRDKGE